MKLYHLSYATQCLWFDDSESNFELKLGVHGREKIMGIQFLVNPRLLFQWPCAYDASEDMNAQLQNPFHPHLNVESVCSRKKTKIIMVCALNIEMGVKGVG